MARPVVFTKALTAANATNIAAGQVPVSGTPLTLSAGASVITLDTPRRVLLTYGNEAAPRTLVISGTAEGGAPISETLVIPSGAGGTMATQQDFATVTSALPGGGGWSVTSSLGTNTVGSTRWWVPNYNQQVQNIEVQIVLVSGAATWQVEITEDDPRAPISIYQPGYSTALNPIPTGIVAPGLGGPAPVQGNINVPALGIRLTMLTGTGQVRATLVQAGIRD